MDKPLLLTNHGSARIIVPFRDNAVIRDDMVRWSVCLINNMWKRLELTSLVLFHMDSTSPQAPRKNVEISLACFVCVRDILDGQGWVEIVARSEGCSVDFIRRRASF